MIWDCQLIEYMIWDCQLIEYMIWRPNLAGPLFQIFLERESALSVEKDKVANVNTSLIGSESRKHTDMKNNIIAINDKKLCSWGLANFSFRLGEKKENKNLNGKEERRLGGVETEATGVVALPVVEIWHTQTNSTHTQTHKHAYRHTRTNTQTHTSMILGKLHIINKLMKSGTHLVEMIKTVILSHLVKWKLTLSGTWILAFDLFFSASTTRFFFRSSTRLAGVFGVQKVVRRLARIFEMPKMMLRRLACPLMVNSFKAKNIDILTEFLQKCSKASKAKSGKNDITSKFQTGQYILLDLSILWPGHKCEGVGVRTGHWPNQPPQIWDAFESPTATESHRFQTTIQEKDRLKIKILKTSVLRQLSTLFR